jgi:O-6-methylguanine DNA methyltransferase
MFTFRAGLGWVSGVITESGIFILTLPMATKEAAEACCLDTHARRQNSLSRPLSARNASIPRPGSMLRKVVIDEKARSGEAADDLALSVAGWVKEHLSESRSGSDISKPRFPLDLTGLSEFRRNVLLAMTTIPFGRVSSYAGLAHAAGYPGCARAVGSVCAENPIPLIIPCHRVVLRNGNLGNFGGGVQMKRQLLEIEGLTLERRAHCWSIEPCRFWTFR